jgi:hypothetical protein
MSKRQIKRKGIKEKTLPESKMQANFYTKEWLCPG